MMLGCKASVQSYTHARKAQKLLEGYGYSCEVHRNPHMDTEGCGYVLLMSGDCTSVSDILVSAGIPYKHLKNVRGYPE
ncbi:MAG: putative Se/S carrier-like protein [Ruminococcus sp.]